uniref:EF-hand domain-containing protein n=1 Tax=Anser brachyrhynchus TaxID=132585 RepID=A0A8B9B965_9AVES
MRSEMLWSGDDLKSQSTIAGILTKAPKKAKKKIEGGSNVFSMFEQTQIQEFKEAFTIMDQNRDGFIDKADLRDTFAALGRLNVKNEELEDMVKEAPGPINFTVFLTMFGEKLKGTDPEETILNAFKIFDPEGKGHIKADYVQSPIQNQPALGWRASKQGGDRASQKRWWEADRRYWQEIQEKGYVSSGT